MFGYGLLFLSAFSIITIRCDPMSDLESTIVSHGGQVLRVTDAGYQWAATLWNTAIQIWPSVILRPARGEGEGVVLDSALLKDIHIDWQNETIQMQAGVIWNEVYTALNGSEYAIIGGLCPTVGVVGYTVGGGYNSLFSRSYGLASDNVLSFKVATYNGTIVTALSTSNAELYWALRGGGGRNFGYVLEMTHKIHQINQTNQPTSQVSFLNITWTNLEGFPAVLRNWLVFVNEVANEDTRIVFDVGVFTVPKIDVVNMFGSFNGPPAELDALYQPWLSKEPKPNFYIVHNYTQFEIISVLSGAAYPFPAKERQHVVSTMAIFIIQTRIETQRGRFQIFPLILLLVLLGTRLKMMLPLLR